MSALNALSAATASTSGASSVAQANQEMGDRFLKLLVTQLQNQDPMNPMDNAQLTSQMAQINTVAGIEKLNTSVAGLGDKLSALDNSATLSALNTTVGALSTQLLQSQTLQGAGLVGRQVWLAGQGLNVVDGVARGAVELSGAADAVRVDVMSASGQLVGTVDLGAHATGRADFQWSPPEGQPTEGYTFRVTALSGGSSVKATALTSDVVQSVSAGAQGLTLNLSGGQKAPLSQVLSIS